jgi:hypothetical protein
MEATPRPTEAGEEPLFVHAQHHRGLGRVQVQPTDVADLAGELWVGGQLPGLGQVWLEAKRPPDPADRGLAHPGRPRHLSGRPVRGIGGGLLQGRHDHLLDLLVGDRAGHPRPRLVDQPLQPAGGEPCSPLADRGRVHAQAGAGRHVGQPLGAGQHDPAAQRQRLAAAATPRPPLQGLALIVRQHDLRRGPAPAVLGLWLLVHPPNLLFPKPISNSGH